MQLLYVDTQIGLAAAGSGTKPALEYRFVAHVVDQFVGLQRVRLCESSVAHVTLVRLLSSVNSQMALQLEGVRGRIRAVRTLIRTFSGMTSDVATQLAQLDTGIVAFGAFVWLFMGVLVSHVSDQFATRGERALAFAAGMRLGASVSVDMVLKGGQGLEATLTHRAFVRLV